MEARNYLPFRRQGLETPALLVPVTWPFAPGTRLTDEVDSAPVVPVSFLTLAHTFIVTKIRAS